MTVALTSCTFQKLVWVQVLLFAASISLGSHQVILLCIWGQIFVGCFLKASSATSTDILVSTLAQIPPTARWDQWTIINFKPFASCGATPVGNFIRSRAYGVENLLLWSETSSAFYLLDYIMMILAKKLFVLQLTLNGSAKNWKIDSAIQSTDLLKKRPLLGTKIDTVY